MGTFIRCVAFAVLAAAGISCGDVVRDGRSPVFLIINQLQAAPGNHAGSLGGNLLSSVITNITSPAPCSPTSPCPTVFNDVGSAILSFQMKDVSVAPSTNNSVTITRIRVDFSRADGRNKPGVDVPYGFENAVTASVLPNAQTTIGFEIVRHNQKEEAPLVQLIANPAVLSTIATITFYGKDRVGNDVSVTGNISVDFGNFANQ